MNLFIIQGLQIPLTEEGWRKLLNQFQGIHWAYQVLGNGSYQAYWSEHYHYCSDSSHWCMMRRIMSSLSLRFNTSLKALTIPIFAATPPENRTGFLISCFVQHCFWSFFASAKHKPATISCNVLAICWWWIMSLLANTLHLPAILGGSWIWGTSLQTPSRWETPILLACWSRNDPVPAAHILFISKSTSLDSPVEGSSSEK